MAIRGEGGGGFFSFYIYIENFKKNSCQKPLNRFQYNFDRMIFWLPDTKTVQTVMIRKNMAARGVDVGLGTYFIYVSI